MQEMQATGGDNGETQAALEQFWPKVTEEIRTMSISDLKRQELPLARIKKIMKLDDDVKMISAEAPVLFGKACEMFIHELTMRAWVHTEDNKRRTLQRNDIAMAITKYDQFDFLIDIVPRDDIKPTAKREDSSVRVAPDQVSYYFQLAQQHQQSLQNNSVAPGAQASAAAGAQQQIQSQPQQQQQVVQSGVQTIAVNPQQPQSTPQVIQLQPQQMNQTTQPPPGGIQIVQQIIGPNGEIQQIPILLNEQQLSLIRSQMIGGTNQPIVIQTAPIQAQAANQTQPLQQVYIQQE